MSAATEGLLRRIAAIDAASAENSQRVAVYAAMTEELKKVTAEVTVPGGITVVAAPGGVIKDIRFTEGVSSIPPRHLARQVQRAVAEAQTEVARKQAEVVRDSLGDTELLDRALESNRQMFGTQTPEVLPEPHRRRWQEPEEEQSLEEFSIFGRAR
ncbi:MAG: YbaB/EbfC family nucleoid-associated protein [Sciscionella sp.]